MKFNQHSHPTRLRQMHEKRTLHRSHARVTFCRLTDLPGDSVEGDAWRTRSDMGVAITLPSSCGVPPPSDMIPVIGYVRVGAEICIGSGGKSLRGGNASVKPHLQ